MFAQQARALKLKEKQPREDSLKIKPTQTLIPLATIYYLQIENTTLKTPFTLADTVETMTDSQPCR